jgi:hypothetical protein
MAWLDDRIRDHPKFVTLSDKAFRYWAHTLCYCSEHGTSGRLNDAVIALRVPSKVTRELTSRGIWDDEQDGLWVHDWQEHNGKRDDAVEERRAAARERQKRHREKVRATNVTRDTSVTERDASRVTNRDTVTRDTSRARAGARPNDQENDQDQEKLNPDLNPPPPEPELQDAGRAEAENNTGETNPWGPYPTPPTAAEWADHEPEPIGAEAQAVLASLTVEGNQP